MSQVAKIRDAGFILELNGDDLDVIPFSQLTPNQLAFLKSHKAEIIDELRQERAANQATNTDRDPFDDRRYCFECAHLINERCVIQRRRPVDTHPKRCADFHPIPDRNPS